MSIKTGNNERADILGGFTDDTPAPKAGKKVCPKLPDDDGFLAKAVDERINLKADLKKLEGRLKQLDDSLKTRGRKYFWEINENQDAPSSSVEATGTNGSLKISVTDRVYPITMDSDGKGAERRDQARKTMSGSFDKYTRETFQVGIPSDKIPADLRKEFLTRIGEVCKEFGVVPTSKQQVELKKEFHIARHSVLTPEENESLQGIWPCTVSLR